MTDIIVWADGTAEAENQCFGHRNEELNTARRTHRPQMMDNASTRIPQTG